MTSSPRRPYPGSDHPRFPIRFRPSGFTRGLDNGPKVLCELVFTLRDQSRIAPTQRSQEERLFVCVGQRGGVFVEDRSTGRRVGLPWLHLYRGGRFSGQVRTPYTLKIANFEQRERERRPLVEEANSKLDCLDLRRKRYEERLAKSPGIWPTQDEIDEMNKYLILAAAEERLKKQTERKPATKRERDEDFEELLEYADNLFLEGLQKRRKTEPETLMDENIPVDQLFSLPDEMEEQQYTWF